MPTNKSRAEGKSVTPETAREVWRQGKFGQPLEGERQDRAAAVQGVQGNLDSEAGRLDGRINDRATISQLDARIQLIAEKAPAIGPQSYPTSMYRMPTSVSGNYPTGGFIFSPGGVASQQTQILFAASSNEFRTRTATSDTAWTDWFGPFATQAYVQSWAYSKGQSDNNYPSVLSVDNRFALHLALNGTKAMTGNLNMGGNSISGVTDPVGDGQAVNLGYMNTHTNFSVSGQTVILPGGWVNFSHSRGAKPVMIAQAYSGSFWTDAARYNCWAEEIDNFTVRVFNGGGASRNVRIFVRRN